ncbi:MAG: DNA-processing protein DprA [Verrucomicrobiales bacterium]
MNSKEAAIALNLLPGIGPRLAAALVEAFGSCQGALAAPRDRLAALAGFGRDKASLVADWENRVDLGRELERIAELGLGVLTLEDRAYPPRLREIYDPPLVLYLRGRIEPADQRSIGVVGSRAATHYGSECARKLSFQLARAGLTVVSGLARGIDTCAHEGAIASGGRTLAVIGSGIGDLYPPENAALADRIADGHGAVLSEFPVDAAPSRGSFPRRNRIISGLSEGVLVVEASERSGALITANQALEQGREVYAVPGPINRPCSRGANRLIQQGARLVLDAGDILEEMSAFAGAPENPSNPGPLELSEVEQSILEALAEAESGIDSIIERSGLPASTVSAALVGLEMKRAVKALPGNHYVRDTE